MNKLYAASLAAIMACASTQAYAAKYLIVDIAAVGTGTGMTGSRTGVRPTTYYSFTTFYASLSYNLEGLFAPRIFDDELWLTGTITAPNVSGRSMASGFGFQVFLPTQHFVNYGIAGNACFANDTPSVMPVGSKTVTPGCGTITANYSDGFAVAGYSFTGVVEGIDFRIVDADALPAITFSIPEPAGWALMLTGFGLTGYALRRRRPRIAFAA